MQEACDTQEAAWKNVSWLPICCIVPRRESVQDEDIKEVRELADSIRQDGLIWPITVRPLGDGRYEVVSGNKRLAACKMCGMMRIDAVVLPCAPEGAEAQRLLLALREGRMHYLEEAEALDTLVRRWHMSPQTLAAYLDWSEDAVNRRMRLLALDEPSRRSIREQHLPQRAAHALLEVADPEERSALLNQAIREKLGARDVELLVESAARRSSQEEKRPAHAVGVVRDARLYVNALRSLCKQMRDSGLPAEISERETLGQLEVVVRIPQKKRRMLRCHHISQEQVRSACP